MICQCNLTVFDNARHDFTILAGQLYVNKDVLTMDELKKELSTVRLGGLWSPSDCTPKAKVCQNMEAEILLRSYIFIASLKGNKFITINR